MKGFNLIRGVTKYWWIPLLTGLLAIGIGIWCLCDPSESLPILAYAFSWCICFAGVFNIFFGFSNTRFYHGWGWSLALGILELICGIWLLSLPVPVLTSAFIFAIGIYIIVIAINAICEACMLYSYSAPWAVLLIALLLVTLFFAIVFLSGPIAGAMAVWLYIGISFIFFGGYRVGLALAIRKINKRIQ